MDFLRSLILAGLLFGGLASSLPATAPNPSTVTAAPSSHESGGDEHIVIINKHAPVTPQVAEVLRRLDLNESHPDVRHIFNNSAFQGFAASMKIHCLDLLANMSDVSMVEKAVSVTHGSVLSYDTRPNAPWGLQRISTSGAVGGSPSNLDYTYSFTDDALGVGSDIYILDTGIETAHNVFGGRASMLWSFDGDMRDEDGHGTHVAGTAAGNILGVASNANIYGVKTLGSDGGGWSSNVVAGIDYVIQRHDHRKASGNKFAGSVISMSLASSGPVESINKAVEAAIEAGIHTCVAAGNANEDACNSSPASSGGNHGGAITVGAVDIDSSRASFSNFGDCVDVYAPGVNIISSWIGQPNMVNSLSGTSMATPHVTGIIAYAISVNSTLAANPSLMKEWIRMAALPLSDGTLLANNGVQADARSQGLLGFDRLSSASAWKVVKTKVQTSGSVETRSFYGLDAAMKCTRGTSVAVAWLCNAKRCLGWL